MSLDPRSRERLAALGRSLPQKLPTPEQLAPAAQPSSPTGRHRLETEQDPEALFRELITASSDGTIPSHLLDRLRELEARRPREPRPDQGWDRPAAALSPAAGNPTSSAGAGPPGKPKRQSQRRGGNPPRARLDPEQEALYNAFHDLLQDEDADT
ncbi:MAG: hypothetical protein ACK5N0_10915 [Synechococcaceae cyanobacterium]